MLSPLDVEALVIARLQAGIAGVTVASEVPRNRPDRLIRVTGTGGSRRNLIQGDTTLLLEAWAPTSILAHALAARAWSILTDDRTEWPGGVITLVDADLPARLPDPTTAHPRYQFLVSLVQNLEITDD